ncbi:MAG: UDP-N-acetylglucosamine 2-epimerase [Verrucomicrobiota bacterium]|nr:UDP-N-acetylglucosamine 2-epimerase [Verrucomicrobiota bacterium]
MGNSSSGIREGAFIGTPVVNLGTRQNDREHGGNVRHVPHEAKAISDAITTQVSHGPFVSEPIYGDGNAGRKIAEILATVDVRVQKQMTF